MRDMPDSFRSTANTLASKASINSPWAEHTVRGKYPHEWNFLSITFHTTYQVSPKSMTRPVQSNQRNGTQVSMPYIRTYMANILLLSNTEFTLPYWHQHQVTWKTVGFATMELNTQMHGNSIYEFWMFLMHKIYSSNSGLEIQFLLSKAKTQITPHI